MAKKRQKYIWIQLYYRNRQDRGVSHTYCIRSQQSSSGHFPQSLKSFYKEHALAKLDEEKQQRFALSYLATIDKDL